MKKIRIETKPVETSVYYCDKCGSPTDDKNGYNAFQCDITLQIGEYTQDDTIAENFRVDLCEPCALTFFNEFLPNNGYKVIDEDLENPQTIYL